jgi:hypothetical protein
VRRETGEEQVVQVHYDEEVATRIGPEPNYDDTHKPAGRQGITVTVH